MNLWNRLLASADQLGIWQRAIVVSVLFAIIIGGVYYVTEDFHEAGRMGAILVVSFLIGLLVRRVTQPRSD